MNFQLPPKQEPVEMIQPSVLVTGTGDNASVIIQEPILQVSMELSREAESRVREHCFGKTG